MDEFEDLPPQYIRFDPRTQRYYFDSQAYEEDLKQEQRKAQFRKYRKNIIEAEGTRRVARFYWRNRGRLGRAARWHYRLAKRAVTKKLGAKYAARAGAKLLLGAETGGLGLVLFLPEAVSVLKSKKTWGILLAIAGVFLAIPILLILALITALDQRGTGGASLEEAENDLAVVKTVNPQQITNTTTPITVQYTIEVTNNSEQEMTSIQVEDSQLGTQTCNLQGGALPPGGKGNCTYSVTVTGQDQRLTNQVIVRGVVGTEQLVGYSVAAIAVGTPSGGDTPCGRPVQGTITQECHSGHATYRVPGKGNALDIAATEGTPILSPMSGTAQRCVISSGRGDGQSYGTQVILSNGTYKLRFAHLNPRAGDVPNHNKKTDGNCSEPFQVVANQTVIGELGNTGNSTGPHLHYEIQRLSDNMLLCPTDFVEGTSALCSGAGGPR